MPLLPTGRVDVLELFPLLHVRLIELLAGLDSSQWDSPTVCAGWSVLDIARHLLADDLGRLSRSRDAYLVPQPHSDEPVVDLVNRINAEWITAARRLSPRVVIELLEVSGPWVHAYFASLDQEAIGSPVSWAGPEPAPVWLDVAREYTERWHHQQQIRDAVGAASLETPELFAPVLATFVFALPHTFRDLAAPTGTRVQVQITGPAGGDWTIECGETHWELKRGLAEPVAARVSIDQTTAWRLFTRGLSAQQAEAVATLTGDPHLSRQVLRTVSIIA